MRRDRCTRHVRMYVLYHMVYVYVYLYIHIYTYIYIVYTYTHIHSRILHTGIYIYIYIHTHTRVHLHIHDNGRGCVAMCVLFCSIDGIAACFGVVAQTVHGLAAATALHRALWLGKAWQLGQERRTERRTVNVAERRCQRKRPLRAR